MTAEQRSRIAGQGGKAAHLYGTAHKWTPEEAREAGRIGGSKSLGRARSSSPQKEEGVV
jgi:general stress protein YciG